MIDTVKVRCSCKRESNSVRLAFRLVPPATSRPASLWLLNKSPCSPCRRSSGFLSLLLICKMLPWLENSGLPQKKIEYYALCCLLVSWISSVLAHTSDNGPVSQISRGKPSLFHPLRLNLPLDPPTACWDYTLQYTLPRIERPNIQFLCVRTWNLPRPSFRFSVTRDTLGFGFGVPDSWPPWDLVDTFVSSPTN